MTDEQTQWLLSHDFQRWTEADEQTANERGGTLVAQSDTGPSVWAYPDPDGDLLVSTYGGPEVVEFLLTLDDRDVIENAYVDGHAVRTLPWTGWGDTAATAGEEG